jgi:hypothetical protein
MESSCGTVHRNYFILEYCTLPREVVNRTVRGRHYCQSVKIAGISLANF